MSCCTVQVKKETSNKYLDILNKHFDEVVIKEEASFTRLTLRDKTIKANYDYIVWLEVKVALGSTNSNSKSSSEKLEDAMKSMSHWVEILKNFEKSDTGKQMSLFAEDNEDDLEPEPKSPQGGEDRSWAKYFRDSERVRRSNLMKQYSFFELFNYVGQWWSYSDTNYVKQLPKTNEDMIELVKKFITGDTSDTIISQEDEWFDEYEYLTRDGALSDIELYDRFMILLRFDLVPYRSYFHAYVDDSFHLHAHEEGISHRYWLNGSTINGMAWENKELPIYDLYDVDFILWLREYFNIPYKDVISDEDILKRNLEGLFCRVYGYENPSFDAIEEIKNAKNFKEFKARAIANADLGNGGGSGYSLDGFRGSYDLFKGRKGNVLTIEQSREQRIALNRNIENLEEAYFKENYVCVYKLKFDECLEQAYKLFKPKELNLFDLMAA